MSSRFLLSMSRFTLVAPILLLVLLGAGCEAKERMPAPAVSSSTYSLRESAGAVAVLTAEDRALIQRLAEESVIPQPTGPRSEWKIPEGVDVAQMRNGYGLTDDTAFAFVERPTMNKPLVDDQGTAWHGTTTFVGLLFTSDRGQVWRRSFEIPTLNRCSGRETFNPVGLFSEGKKYYLDIADDCGAGSGEGNMIRYASTNGADWKQESCYYFVPEKYYNIDAGYRSEPVPATGLPEIKNPHLLERVTCS